MMRTAAGLALAGVLALMPGQASAQGCVHCYDGLTPCLPDEHDAPFWVPYSEYGGTTHSACRSSSCVLAHGLCVIGDENDADVASLRFTLLERVHAALSRPDATEIMALSAKLPAQVLFTPQRRALHVLDCAGHVVAMYPVTDRQVQWFLPDWLAGALLN